MKNTAPTTRSIRLAPRYARICTDAGIDMAEANYLYAHLDWDMPLAQTALVCIDCWAWHFSRETLERIEEITRDRISALLDACRKRGLPVIHMPADPVASKHPNFLRMRPEGSRPQAEWPDSPEWPPRDFRTKTGDYAEYAKPVEPREAERNEHRETKRTFHPLCEPVGDEPVLLDGEDLHRFCAARGILHLFFLGFNTNACVMMRDYGLPAMARRGYHTILLRDCTTGMEVADTVEDLTCTRGTIATIEQFLGYTVAAAELIAALNAAQ
jgi:nicotinamidase-related amidase